MKAHVGLPYPRWNARKRYTGRMTLLTAAESFLTDFHDAHPGCTARAFSQSASGPTGYERLVATVPPRARAVLDLACGDGFLLDALGHGRPGVARTGVDLSSGELEWAHMRLGNHVPLHHARAQDLPFQDAAFDAVLCHMALMLMDDLDDVMAEVRRVLAPGGVFAAVVSGAADPSPARTLFTRLRTDANRPVPHPPLGDARLLSDPIALFEAAGFQTPSVKPFSLMLRRDPRGTWDAFAEMYPIGALPDEELAAFEAAFIEEAALLVDSGGNLDLPWGLCLIEATVA